MHDMSNTRKEIVARLGFAAGNNAKVSFEGSEGNYFVISGYVDNSILGNRTFDTQAEAEHYGKQMLETLKKSNPRAKDVNVQISKVVKYQQQTPFKTLSSRPGAKASFGRAEDVYRLLETTPGSYNNAKKRDALATEAMRLADITPTGKDVSLHELAEMVGQDLEGDRSRAARPGTKTRMTREQTEEQKAGLKIMSAADPAVGAKIAKLIKEGKPQDQAVAIALDMKRRGEL